MSYIDASFFCSQDSSAICTDTSSNVCTDISCSIYPYGSDTSGVTDHLFTGWENQPNTCIVDFSGCDISVDVSGSEYHVHTIAYPYGNGIIVETEITSLDSCGNTIVDVPFSTFVTDEIPMSTSTKSSDDRRSSTSWSSMDLVVEGHASQRSSDQNPPVAKLPLNLVVEGLRPSDQNPPVAKLPLNLVVEGLRPSDQNALVRFRSYCAKALAPP